MTIQPDHNSLNVARIIAKGADWMRAGREVYKREAKGDHPAKPSDIIRAAERPCDGKSANVCAAEGCFGQTCTKEAK